MPEPRDPHDPIGGGGPGEQPRLTKKSDKKPCKQDKNGSKNEAEIRSYLDRAGLNGLIDLDSITPSKEGITFTFNDRNTALRSLNSNPSFRGPNIFPLNSQHTGQVGGSAQDYRSYTVGREALGPKSLQVEVGPAGRVPGTSSGAARGYADLDCSNPAQDVVSLIKHLFGH